MDNCNCSYKCEMKLQLCAIPFWSGKRTGTATENSQLRIGELEHVLFDLLALAFPFFLCLTVDFLRVLGSGKADRPVMGRAIRGN